MRKQRTELGWRMWIALTVALSLGIVGCAATRPPELSPEHLKVSPRQKEEIPSPVTEAPVLPPPKLQPALDTYTVVVNEVPAKELLFSLARDAKLNVDIHPGIQGVVTLNAVNQTLPQILDRIAKQVSFRYQLDGPNLVVSPDTPYWRTYTVNYLNMARDSVSEVGVATQIATTGGSVAKDNSSAQQQGNVSTTKVTNTSKNHFWETIAANIRAITGERSDNSAAGSADSGGTSSEQNASSVIVNPVSGIISVKATQHQHQQIQSFLDIALANALRQVLIEMTIVEVQLGDRYQAGVDWQHLASGNGLSAISTLVGANLSTPPAFSLNFSNTSSSGSNIAATLHMLETFGKVKVLSSPKIMALNNQTALLKVVDENVYFTITEQIIDATTTTPASRTFTSDIHTVPVGMVMSVMPQINEDNNVTLNIRPTISRITGYATDPAPRLSGANFDNLVPEIQVREMESVLQVASGQMIVMGGLMQNKIDKTNNGIPLLSSLPVVGPLFNYRDDNFTKTELVIFLRPTVIKSAGVGFDLAAYRDYLPSGDDRLAAGSSKTQNGAPATGKNMP